MKTFAKLGMGAALLAALALLPASVVASEDEHEHATPQHMGHPHGPPQGYHGRMPERGFHGAPRGFQGPMPHERGGPPNGGHAAATMPAPERHGSFHGRDFAQFSAQDREHWRHGEWRHSSHNGHFGWWWFVDGSWFFYPEPIYPFPTYVGPADYYEDEGYGPDYYWYWCDDPEGYYPYVQDCNVPWEAVPPTE